MALARPALLLSLALAASGAPAQPFVPPAGFGGKPSGPAVIPPAPGVPALSPIDDSELAGLIRMDPAYRRAASAAAKVIGAYRIAEPARLVEAWAPGFLPVTLAFADGKCFRLEADYVGSRLSRARMAPSGCEHLPPAYEPPQPPPPPPGRALRLVGTAWGYAAWADDRAGTTIVTAPGREAFEPLFTARMAVSAIMAINGPDWPGGNMTLVGRIEGRLVVVVLQIAY
jgi:hypothetical protein